MIPQEQGEASFVDGTGREFKDGLSGFRFGGGEVQTIAFEEHIAGHETGSLVAIHEWMV